MSITAETAKEHAHDPAVLCCRAEGGITIQAANLEDPAIFDDLVDSGLLKLDGTLTIEQVLGAKLVKTCDSLTPLTADLVEGAKAPAAEEAPAEEAYVMDDATRKANVDADIKIAQAAVVEKEKRVAELNEELRDLGQLQADIEKNIDTVLNFSIQKNKALAEKINPFFHHFQFSFLDYTIEGNPVETCKMICNGIDYNSGLNHSDKILCEVDLLNGLQEMNGLNLPIWIDDSESIDKSRIPVLDRQMIVLRVTDDDLTAKEL